MLYDMKADAFEILNGATQQDRSRELTRQRLLGEALVGQKKHYTSPIPSLVERLRQLVEREPGITPRSAS
jgi:hypothetical protein